MNTEQLKSLSLQEVGQKLKGMVESPEFLVSEAVNIILEKGVLCRASDMHLTPTSDGLRIRFRVDGLFQDLAFLPQRLHEQIVSRTKVMANLMSHKRAVVQEGRISLNVDEKTVDLRLSVIPTVLGEKMVIRVFYPQQAIISLEELGYDKELLKQYEQLLFDLKGMIILTGPSGTGKTTTLYSSLHKVSTELDKYASIITIEDPVEYAVGLFSQMQVNRLQGVDFVKGLSAILRQDPEVIMVGEIRDSETCEVALRAGLTGHLILTTIHSGTSYEVITRLINMGIEPFVIASAITGVVAQRLVRRICPNCQTNYEPDPVKMEFFKEIADFDGIEFKKGAGCKECENSGYKGRIPLAELLVFTEEVRSFILQRAKSSMIRDFVIKNGLRTFLHDGLEKVKQGITTVEEVFRVVSYREIYDIAQSCRKNSSTPEKKDPGKKQVSLDV